MLPARQSAVAITIKTFYCANLATAQKLLPLGTDQAIMMQATVLTAAALENINLAK